MKFKFKYSLDLLDVDLNRRRGFKSNFGDDVAHRYMYARREHHPGTQYRFYTPARAFCMPLPCFRSEILVLKRTDLVLKILNRSMHGITISIWFSDTGRWLYL